MIKSTTITLNKSKIKFDNIKIEETLKDLGYEIIRWSIVKVEEETFDISLSFFAKV